MQDNLKKYSRNRPFARWHHFTTTTRILQGFAFLCKVGRLSFKPPGITKFKYERKNEKDSSCSSKMTPSCKCPIQRHTHCYFIACRLRSKNERRNTATKVWKHPTWWFEILTIDCFLFKRVNKQLTQKWFNACILSQQYKIMLLSYSLEVYQKIFSIVRECYKEHQ